MGIVMDFGATVEELHPEPLCHVLVQHVPTFDQVNDTLVAMGNGDHVQLPLMPDYTPSSELVQVQQRWCLSHWNSVALLLVGTLNLCSSGSRCANW